MWLWHSGDPLDLVIAESEASPSRKLRLGGRVDDGEQPQVIVPRGHWQAAEPVSGGAAGYTFLSCVVAPAFEFSGYELAPPGWVPGNEA